MSEDLSSLEESTTAAFEKLRDNMPSIGFISRKKRIKGYIQITEVAQYMISNQEITEESALYILSIMMRKVSNFQKAATMTAFSLKGIGKNAISPIGLQFVLEVRKNLNLPATHHSPESPANTDKKSELDKID